MEWNLILIFSFVIVITGIVCFAVHRIVTALLARGGGKGMGEDETIMIQEIYQGLRRMEDRVESLETILGAEHRQTARRQADPDLWEKRDDG